jgi:DNA-binding NarL/FixJ family response regulator
VVDINLPGPDTLTILAQLIALAPQARRIVLVDHAAQQQALQPAPADLVLLKGFPAAELYALLEKLLAQES